MDEILLLSSANDLWTRLLPSSVHTGGSSEFWAKYARKCNHTQIAQGLTSRLLFLPETETENGYVRVGARHATYSADRNRGLLATATAGCALVVSEVRSSRCLHQRPRHFVEHVAQFPRCCTSTQTEAGHLQQKKKKNRAHILAVKFPPDLWHRASSPRDHTSAIMVVRGGGVFS